VLIELKSPLKIQKSSQKIQKIAKNDKTSWGKKCMGKKVQNLERF
jgi:hypothetical protein